MYLACRALRCASSLASSFFLFAIANQLLVKISYQPPARILAYLNGW
jgi:hypothetical protein